MNAMRYYILSLFFCLGLVSCHKEEKKLAENERTLLVYMPWANNLYSAFRQNLDDLEYAVEKNKLQNQRIIVFLADSNDSANLFEIKLVNGVCVEEPIQTLSFPEAEFTTESGLTSILTTMITKAPAKEYSMIIGCHGLGWIPVTRTSEPVQSTRWFGGTSSKYQTEITTLSSALSNLNLKLQFLLFDDCYMANAEVAYQLKDVTNYLIGSTCEIMSYGMPYHEIGPYLLGVPNYKKVCDKFLEFYSGYSSPYGTIGVASTSQMPRLAQEMKKLNDTYSFDESLTYSIQRMDGYAQPIFFDFGDYATKLAGGTQNAQNVLNQLELTVPYKAHTPQFYTMTGSTTFDILSFSGITISDPSPNTSTNKKKETAWWKATH